MDCQWSTVGRCCTVGCVVIAGHPTTRCSCLPISGWSFPAIVRRVCFCDLLPPYVTPRVVACWPEGTVTAALWLASGLAVAGGIGIALLILVILLFNKPALAERIAPQLRGHSAVNPTEQPALTTLGTLSKLVAPVIQTGVEQLNKLNLGNNQLAARLAQAGSRLNVSDYRAQQLITAACF